MSDSDDDIGGSTTSLNHGDAPASGYPCSRVMRAHSPTHACSAKKVRKNHNEFERKRRDLQRLRLEELRQSVPGLDTKASMVAVLTGARQYIADLCARNKMLETAVMGPRAVPLAGDRWRALQGLRMESQSPGTAPQGPGTAPQGPGVAPRGPRMAVPPLLPATALATRNSSDGVLMRSVQPRVTPEPAKLFRQGRSEVLDALPPVFGFSQGEARRPNVLSSKIQDSFYTSRPRTGSGVLLPTEDPQTFYFGHRDGMQSMEAVPLPLILDQSSPAYVQCVGCKRGVDGLVMIDCDMCRRWYHIRCVGIDSTSIPVSWACPACAAKTAQATQAAPP